MEILLTPEREMLIHYIDRDGEEVVLAKLRGSFGTRLFSNLWKLDGPGIWIGYRVYPSGVEPVQMGITVVQKLQSGVGSSGFLDPGERSHEIILFSEQGIEFAGTPLERDSRVPAAALELLSNLKRLSVADD